jgi:hypothetical protein
MAKALELSPETLTAPPVPKAAQLTTSQAVPVAMQSREAKLPEPKAEVKEPLQVRWPGDDVKAAKLAAIQLDFPTVSDFMLACFHAYMKNQKQA